MKFAHSLRATAMLPLCALFAGCVSTSIANDVPQCDRLVPPNLLAHVPSADIPETLQLPDGHDDAQPWQVGFLEQTANLVVANGHKEAVAHIYQSCLANHREALARARRGFFGRLFH